MFFRGSIVPTISRYGLSSPSARRAAAAASGAGGGPNCGRPSHTENTLSSGTFSSSTISRAEKRLSVRIASARAAVAWISAESQARFLASVVSGMRRNDTSWIVTTDFRPRPSGGRMKLGKW